MPPSKIRFVTACQQFLALGVVLAALTPAASVISLAVVREHRPATTASGSAGGASAEFAAYTRATKKPSLVPTTTVDPKVHSYSLTAVPGARMAPSALAGR